MTTLTNHLNAEFGPRLAFDRSRWASFREESVKAVTKRWEDRPNLVQIMEDPRLGTAKLVILRKDLFEQLVAAMDRLISGRSAIQLDVEQITKITTVIHSMVKKGGQENVATLAETVIGTAQRLKAQIVPAGPVSPLKPSRISDTEHEFLLQQDKLDSDDN